MNEHVAKECSKNECALDCALVLIYVTNNFQRILLHDACHDGVEMNVMNVAALYSLQKQHHISVNKSDMVHHWCWFGLNEKVWDEK